LRTLQNLRCEVCICARLAGDDGFNVRAVPPEALFAERGCPRTVTPPCWTRGLDARGVQSTARKKTSNGLDEGIDEDNPFSTDCVQ